jgi:DNA (cytosine-5)-methyltransferase 1
MAKQYKKVKFIDLFAGLGGTRIGFEKACFDIGIKSECVFTSEIKEHAIKTYKENFPGSNVSGDITKIKASDIPDFDFLLGGFPCQAFSFAGSRRGFGDTRGTLFFEIERILKEKNPEGFLLENVEGLITHDRVKSSDPIGRTLQTILDSLKRLEYNVSWNLLNAADFGVPQSRKRVYIVGSRNKAVNMENFPLKTAKIVDVLEKGISVMSTPFVENLLKHYKVKELYGKSIKDKRGGDDNIHSWNLGLKGEVTDDQKKLLDLLLRERRKKKWALQKGINWMDGMPLTLEEISTFYSNDLFHSTKKQDLKSMLDDLADKGYVTYEHPKDLVVVKSFNNVDLKQRSHSTTVAKGYNIVAGKLSFEISKVLDPNGLAPTLVATDMEKLAVADGKGLRRISIREGLRMFGFPETYKIDLPTRQAYDVLGNSIVVPVVQTLSKRLLLSSLN